jgi:hypothetical protein
VRKRFVQLFNDYLDKLVRPEVRLFNRHLFTYQVCGYTGLVLAILLAMTLAAYSGLSLSIMAGVIGVAMLTFLGLAMVTKIITGEERIIYYHHQIAVIVMAAVFLNILSQPVLVYLDMMILGVGVFLVVGRIGCFMVGCCHGRPYKWGVRYRKEHVDAGFTPYYVGVRLFPIQAVESLWVLGVVLTGILFVLGGRPPGQTLAWYIITYSIGRFCFEFARGDPERTYCWGFSEAQWTSVILMCAVVWAEVAGTLIFHTWHIIVTAVIVLTIIAVALIRRFRPTAKHKLLNPHHIQEVAEAVEQVSGMAIERIFFYRENAVPEVIPMSCTSLGIQISSGKIEDAEMSIDHYAFSSQKETMTEKTAEIIADLIIQLRHSSCSRKLITKNRGIFHLLIRPLTAGVRK